MPMRSAPRASMVAAEAQLRGASTVSRPRELPQQMDHAQRGHPAPAVRLHEEGERALGPDRLQQVLQRQHVVVADGAAGGRPVGEEDAVDLGLDLLEDAPASARRGAAGSSRAAVAAPSPSPRSYITSGERAGGRRRAVPSGTARGLEAERLCLGRGLGRRSGRRSDGVVGRRPRRATRRPSARSDGATTTCRLRRLASARVSSVARSCGFLTSDDHQLHGTRRSEAYSTLQTNFIPSGPSRQTPKRTWTGFMSSLLRRAPDRLLEGLAELGAVVADGVVLELDALPEELADRPLEVVERLLVLAEEEPAEARGAFVLQDLPFDVVGLRARCAVEDDFPGRAGVGGDDRRRPVLALRNAELLEDRAEALLGLRVPDGQPADAH